jgi:prepilin-type N-terminal cleavage/methylation domain-containing protein
MLRPGRHSAGYSLVELLIVVTLIGIMAGLLLPTTNPSIRDQLQMAAEILAGDVAYARNLAVANGSQYRLTFDSTNQQYVLQHSGTNTALNTLPYSPYRLSTDSATQQTTRFAELPHVGAPVRIHAVSANSTPVTTVTDLEFGPLGQTTRTTETVIWLAAGTGTATRYISVRVNPITGLNWVENFQGSAPAAGS